MISTTIPVQGTFDIAKGRNSLRAHIAAQRWSPTFGARAAAALTALGELILNAQGQNLVIVRLNVIDEGEVKGVQFVCNIQINDADTYENAAQRLQRAADDLDVREVAQNAQIVASVYV